MAQNREPAEVLAAGDRRAPDDHAVNTAHRMLRNRDAIWRRFLAESKRSRYNNYYSSENSGLCCVISRANDALRHRRIMGVLAKKCGNAKILLRKCEIFAIV